MVSLSYFRDGETERRSKQSDCKVQDLEIQTSKLPSGCSFHTTE